MEAFDRVLFEGLFKMKISNKNVADLVKEQKLMIFQEIVDNLIAEGFVVNIFKLDDDTTERKWRYNAILSSDLAKFIAENHKTKKINLLYDGGIIVYYDFNN